MCGIPSGIKEKGDNKIDSSQKSPINLQLGLPVFTNAQTKALEASAAEYTDDGRSVLMEKAGLALYNNLQTHFPNANHYHIVCGRGNNGGDGFVLARHAAQAGILVTIYQHDEPTAQDATSAYRQLPVGDLNITPLSEFAPISGVIVDCLFGTGLNDAPREPFNTYIQQLNNYPLPVVSADIPSGLRADAGSCPGAVVSADMTVTFIGYKPGVLTGAGKNVCGDVIVESLDIDTTLAETNTHKMTPAMFKRCLPERAVDSHKGMFGHVLVVGGDKGYGGAAYLAASTALRSGAGLVSVITHPAHASAVLSGQPELMVNAIAAPEADKGRVDTLLNQCDVVVMGPGLGRNEFGQAFFSHVIDHITASNKPAVLDADALHFLANKKIPVPSAVLTPHPGEAASLLSCGKQVVSQDRIKAVRGIQHAYGAITLLKGAGSLVFDGEEMLICGDGNAGMASGGMGDVLSGLVGALLAQHLTPMAALAYGVQVHALAGDSAANREGQVGMLASDLLPEIRSLLNSNRPI